MRNRNDGNLRSLFIAPGRTAYCLCLYLTFTSLSFSHCAADSDGIDDPQSIGIYYVDRTHPNAGDSNNGSEDSPWLTIQHAANILSAGDTVYIKAGTYPEHVIVNVSGGVGSPITFAAYPGHEVIIDGAAVDLPEWDGLFQVLGVNNIIVRGLTILNSRPFGTNTGIQVEDAANIVVQGNHTSQTYSSGIFVWNSVNIVVENNEIDHAMAAGADSLNECLTVGRSTNCEIRGNHVHDGHPSRGEGICIKDGTSDTSAHHNYVHHVKGIGIYIDAWTEHTFGIDVFANRVHDVDGNGISVASEEGGFLEQVLLCNNFVWHNRYLGLNISNCCIASHPMADIAIINNSVWGNGWSDWGGGIGLDNEQITGLVIRNNACAGNLSFEIVAEGLDPSGWTLDHNLIDGWDGYPGELCGTDCRIGDPRWADPIAGDLHLQQGSAAIDHGTATAAPITDIDGESRPIGAGFDIGADEWSQATTVPALSPIMLCIAGACFSLLLGRNVRVR